MDFASPNLGFAAALTKMNFRFCSLASRCWLVTLVVLLALTPVLRAAEEAAPEKLLVGIWQYKDANFLGGFEGYTIRRADGTMVQIGHLLKKDFWFAMDNTWTATGETVSEKATRSYPPGGPVGESSTSKTLQLDAKTYVYQEKSGGKRTETKVDSLPAEFKARLDKLTGDTVHSQSPGKATP